jgi:hypothetical protein
MGRNGWILGAALVLAIYATPASAQVSVAVGIGTPHIGARVIVGGPPVYVVDPYYYGVPYAYYDPYYDYPYAVPYGRVYYRSRPAYYYRGGRAPYYYSRSRDLYYGRDPYYGRGPAYYGRGPSYYRGVVAPGNRGNGRAVGRVNRGGPRYARAGQRR